MVVISLLIKDGYIVLLLSCESEQRFNKRLFEESLGLPICNRGRLVRNLVLQRLLSLKGVCFNRRLI